MSNSATLPCRLALTVLLVAGAVAADDLVTNGDFAADTTHWRMVGRGTVSHHSDGGGASGSLQGEGGLAGNATHVVVGQCLTPVSGGQTVAFSANVRVVSGSPEHCRIALFESSRSDCLWIIPADEVRRTTFSGGWDGLAGGSHTTSAMTHSVELRLHCATAGGDTGALQVRFDDVQVETVGLSSVIFSDTFESADTSMWSASVP